MLPTAADLAPGDSKSLGLDLSAFEVHRIRSIEDEWFEAGYRRLWDEFGASGEMERRETLGERFALRAGIRYEMVFVRKDATFAAVRDHTAIDAGDEVIVHLSHNLVAPEFRRSGLAGWMRAFPVELAREIRPGVPVTLVAEMEYGDGDQPAQEIRLRAYERAGFSKIDPGVVEYHQPDFRPPEVIDATGGAQPPAFQLVVRRVGREEERRITGAEVRRMVGALYRMYGAQFRAQDMAHPALDLSRYPEESAEIALLPPSE